MKLNLTLVIFLLAAGATFAQQKTNVLVISNKEGRLLVDGIEQIKLKPSETTKLVLEEGDHIIQVVTSTETLTKTMSCNDGKQKVVSFDFSSENVPPASVGGQESMNVADIQLDLPGSLSGGTVVHKVYAFDQGDEISFDFDILNRNGTVNIYFYSYPDKALLYSKEKTNAVMGETIRIPKRGVYYFNFSTNHVVSRSAHFAIKRLPGPGASKSFNTAVLTKYDTSYQEILNSQVRVYSAGNIGHPNRTIVRVDLPENTLYWVYWIGVGQESVDQMKNFADKFSKGAIGLVTNPLCALGLGLIPSLPMFNSTATVDYRFADNMNSNIFFSGNPSYRYYTFKEGRNVTTDYGITKTVAKEMNLCLWNNSQLTGHDVTVRVVAFTVKPSFVPEAGF